MLDIRREAICYLSIDIAVWEGRCTSRCKSFRNL